jgi:RNA polymerase sigma-70 factor, ECF subfamily
MSNFPSDSALSVPLTGSADTAVATSLGLVEQEVISLFDQLRTSLLRYLLSFGLSVQDSEEVVQEAFLALFRDLRAGKSRRHLRGWVFRVAHNLALKRCASVRRELRTFLFGADSHQQAAETMVRMLTVCAFRKTPSFSTIVPKGSRRI